MSQGTEVKPKKFLMVKNRTIWVKKKKTLLDYNHSIKQKSINLKSLDKYTNEREETVLHYRRIVKINVEEMRQSNHQWNTIASKIYQWMLKLIGKSLRRKKVICIVSKYLCGKFWEMGISDHLTCLLRKLYAGQEATVTTGHGTTDWFQIGKVVRQGCILLPCLFNLYAEYIMRNAGLEEAQAGIKIAGRNINNLRYADDTTLWQKVRRN